MLRPLRWLRAAVAIPVAALLLSLHLAVAIAAEAPTGGATAGDDAVVVTVSSYSYRPDRVEVTAGGQIRWRWEGEEGHSVTATDRSFDSDPDCEDNVLLRGNCRTGGSDDFVWTAPEVSERTEITYHCKLHGASEGMTGTVVVVPAAAPAESPQPAESPEPSPGPSSSPAGGDGGGSGSEQSEPSTGHRTGTAPQLGTQTAPGTSPPPVASPQVASPVDDPVLEPFPSPAPIPTASASDDLGEVALDLPRDGDRGLLRTVLLTVATLAVAGTAVAFGQLVLFGPRWR